MLDKKQWRVYKSQAARASALTQMLRHGKYNYIVLYTDTRGPAINCANVPWVGRGKVHIDR